MQPVVELKGRIIQVRTSSEGETRRLRRDLDRGAPSRIADRRGRLCRRLSCAPAGAAKASPRREVIVAGKRCPIAGRVSMDLLAVDVTDLPEGAARRGDFATLIGDGIERR